jgi:hypothetical protein
MRGGSGVASKRVVEKDGKARMRSDRMRRAQFYRRGRRQCDDSLPRKMCLSVSTTRAIRMRDQEAKR